MLPSTFDLLKNRLGPILAGNTGNKPCIPVRTQLLASLWLLATPDSFSILSMMGCCYTRSVGLKHDLAKSSMNVSVQRVVAALNDIAKDIIRWPTGDCLNTVKQKFQRLSNMPDVIGAIDGCNISIEAPKAVCDSELRFIDCFAGYPGSVGDRRIFRNSDLFLDAERNVNALFPNGEYIIADKAYPVLSWCIPPYIDNGRLTQCSPITPHNPTNSQKPKNIILSKASRGVMESGSVTYVWKRFIVQKRFNTTLSKSRQVVERSFALLKGRFRRLKHLDMKRTDLIPSFILACCVLHNICLSGLGEVQVEDNNVDDFIGEGF
ncbi:PREDICTED: putative nuclease HARBI1, partial [Vollenhovia emeryi]|uniref:putative nuclease HARBI1 n=1 Tax=Vollenhovia emeryi TaxID=411798 RepID=UPI0005F4708F